MEKRPKRALQVSSIHDQHPVEAFGTYPPHESFGDPIRLRCFDRRSNGQLGDDRSNAALPPAMPFKQGGLTINDAQVARGKTRLAAAKNTRSAGPSAGDLATEDRQLVPKRR
jgi:hypothetical protein